MATKTSKHEQVFGELRRRAREAAKRWHVHQDDPQYTTRGKCGVFHDLTKERVEQISSWQPGNRMHTQEFNEWLAATFPSVVKNRLHQKHNQNNNNKKAQQDCLVALLELSSGKGKKPMHEKEKEKEKDRDKDNQNKTIEEPTEPYPDSCESENDNENESRVQSGAHRPLKRQKVSNETQNLVIDRFPLFYLPAFLYDTEGKTCRDENLTFHFEMTAAQPRLTKRKSISVGEMWIAASDFIRFIGPRDDTIKYRSRLKNIAQYARQRCGMFKTHNNKWMLGLSTLISMHQFRTEHQTVYKQLRQFRDQLQFHLDDHNILLLS